MYRSVLSLYPGVKNSPKGVLVKDPNTLPDITLISLKNSAAPRSTGAL